MSKVKAWLDLQADKAISRKFTVFIVSTVGLFTGHLDGSEWAALSMSYVGVQGALDYAKAKHGA